MSAQTTLRLPITVALIALMMGLQDSSWVSQVWQSLFLTARGDWQK
jgi:hypothetical protein